MGTARLLIVGATASRIDKRVSFLPQQDHTRSLDERFLFLRSKALKVKRGRRGNPSDRRSVVFLLSWASYFILFRKGKVRKGRRGGEKDKKKKDERERENFSDGERQGKGKNKEEGKRTGERIDEEKMLSNREGRTERGKTF